MGAGPPWPRRRRASRLSIATGVRTSTNVGSRPPRVWRARASLSARSALPWPAVLADAQVPDGVAAPCADQRPRAQKHDHNGPPGVVRAVVPGGHGRGGGTVVCTLSTTRSCTASTTITRPSTVASTVAASHDLSWMILSRGRPAPALSSIAWQEQVRSRCRK
jgi:hypothetical protein